MKDASNKIIDETTQKSEIMLSSPHQSELILNRKSIYIYSYRIILIGNSDAHKNSQYL